MASFYEACFFYLVANDCLLQPPAELRGRMHLFEKKKINIALIDGL